jgi:hypothetical protein
MGSVKDPVPTRIITSGEALALLPYAQFRKAQLQQMLQSKVSYATAQCVVLIHSCQPLPYFSIKSFPSLRPLYEAAPSASPATHHALKFSPSTIAISKSCFLSLHGSLTTDQLLLNKLVIDWNVLIGPSLISSLSSGQYAHLRWPASSHARQESSSAFVSPAPQYHRPRHPHHHH